MELLRGGGFSGGEVVVLPFREKPGSKHKENGEIPVVHTRGQKKMLQSLDTSGGQSKFVQTLAQDPAYIVTQLGFSISPLTTNGDGALTMTLKAARN